MLLSQVHPGSHVSQLRHALGDHSGEAELPPGLENDEPTTIEPEAILAGRDVQKQGERETEWLI